MNFKWIQTQITTDLGHPSCGALNLWNHPAFWLGHLGQLLMPTGKGLFSDWTIWNWSAAWLFMSDTQTDCILVISAKTINWGKARHKKCDPFPTPDRLLLTPSWDCTTAVGGCVWLSKLVPVYKNGLITSLLSPFSWYTNLSNAICLVNAAVPRKRVITFLSCSLDKWSGQKGRVVWKLIFKIFENSGFHLDQFLDMICLSG